MQIVTVWPQLVIVSLLGWQLGVNTVKIVTTNDAPTRLGLFVGTIAHPIVWLWLLYQGGFFS